MKIGIGSALTIIFIVLKILGKIDWSWFIVFLPMIISAAITLIIVIAMDLYQDWLRKHF